MGKALITLGMCAFLTLPSATSTSLTMLSSPAAASRVPSGEKASARTGRLKRHTTRGDSRPGSLYSCTAEGRYGCRGVSEYGMGMQGRMQCAMGERCGRAGTGMGGGVGWRRGG